MRKQLLILVLFLISAKVLGCSCGPTKIVNAYSIYNFIGVVEFTSLTKIENSYGMYESTFNIKELFKGIRSQKIYIDSMEGSSCGFLPKKNTPYFIFAYKTRKGKTVISYCQAQSNPDEKTVSIVRELSRRKIGQTMSSNLRQRLKGDLNSELFESSLNAIFIYKVSLNSDLSISKIQPQNEHASMNFNEEIKRELKKKIVYEINEDDIKTKKKNLTSYIILDWQINYEDQRVISIPTL